MLNFIIRQILRLTAASGSRADADWVDGDTWEDTDTWGAAEGGGGGGAVTGLTLNNGGTIVAVGGTYAAFQDLNFTTDGAGIECAFECVVDGPVGSEINSIGTILTGGSGHQVGDRFTISSLLGAGDMVFDAEVEVTSVA